MEAVHINNVCVGDSLVTNLKRLLSLYFIYLHVFVFQPCFALVFYHFSIIWCMCILQWQLYIRDLTASIVQVKNWEKVILLVIIFVIKLFCLISASFLLSFQLHILKMVKSAQDLCKMSEAMDKNSIVNGKSQLKLLSLKTLGKRKSQYDDTVSYFWTSFCVLVLLSCGNHLYFVSLTCSFMSTCWDVNDAILFFLNLTEYFCFVSLTCASIQ